MSLALFGLACGDARTPAASIEPAPGVTAEGLRHRLGRLAPVTIEYPAEVLNDRQRQVLFHLVRAAQYMDSIFLLQVAPRNPEWRAQLEAAGWEGADAALEYFEIMFGPWDRLEEDTPFLDVGVKPEGAGYYPADLTREEFDSWLAAHRDDREAFTGYFSAIRRENDSLVAIPYSSVYAGHLKDAARWLTEAAELTENPALRRYLNLRARGFLTDDYFASDTAWMGLEANLIEPTIGPYEVYEDDLLGYKAAFEAFIAIREPGDTKRLGALESRLPELQAALPVEEAHRGEARGRETPIVVVTEVFTAGDTRAGVQTLAFALPNDERVRELRGTKLTLLKNVMAAKFEKIARPIAESVLDPSQHAGLGFEPYFTAILMHELAHGLGPGYIRAPDGTRTTVNRALRDRYSAIEEAKADVLGLWSLSYLGRAGMYDPEFVRSGYLSHVPDMFRAVRFGATEAHAIANLIEFNYLRDAGAVRYDTAGRVFEVDYEAMVEAVEALARELLTIEGSGDYRRATRLVERFGQVAPAMREVLDRLSDVPVDIRPSYRVLDDMRETES